MTNPPTKHIKPVRADASRKPDPKAEAEKAARAVKSGPTF
jgi:large subunit ribosomal protein L23Ae